MRSGTKLRNLSLIFRTPGLGSGALQLKLTPTAVRRRTKFAHQGGKVPMLKHKNRLALKKVI